MNLSRSNNKAVASSLTKITDLADYVRPILEIYQSSAIPRNLWLTDKEKDFYVAMIVHVLEGHVNPIAPESVQIYRKYFDSATTKTKIADYLGRIRKKEWIKYDKFEKVVVIPPLFKQIKKEGDSIEFNLSFEYDTQSASD